MSDMTHLYEDMEAVRQSGLTNMFDRKGVAQAAHMMGLDDLGNFLDEAAMDEFLSLLREFPKAVQ